MTMYVHVHGNLQKRSSIDHEHNIIAFSHCMHGRTKRPVAQRGLARIACPSCDVDVLIKFVTAHVRVLNTPLFFVICALSFSVCVKLMQYSRCMARL